MQFQIKGITIPVNILVQVTLMLDSTQTCVIFSLQNCRQHANMMSEDSYRDNVLFNSNGNIHFSSYYLFLDQCRMVNFNRRALTQTKPAAEMCGCVQIMVQRYTHQSSTKILHINTITILHDPCCRDGQNNIKYFVFFNY